jgi:hypothetical protein
MSIQNYKNIEIDKLIDQAFSQFNIVDSAERLDIASSIKSQLKTNDVLSNFTSEVIASSSKYRAEVRLALIDIIAQLLHAKDMNSKINQLEGSSRETIEEALTKIHSLEKTILQKADNIKETFEEHVDSGIHNNTMIKDGQLSVSKFGTLSKLSNINIVISPAASIQDNVTVSTSGNLEDLIYTGVGTDSYWVRVVTPSIPEFFENNRMIKGALLSLELGADSGNNKPIMAAIKGSGFFRIFSLEGSIDDGLTWDFLGKDPSYGDSSFVEINSDISYSSYRVKLHIPSGELIDGIYYYNLGLHNIKIFNKNSFTERLIGKFKSYSYTSDKALFKTKFDCNFEGFCNFKIGFDGRKDIEPIQVLPRDMNTAKIFKFFKNGEDSITLPFPLKENNVITITDQYGVSFEIETATNIISIPETVQPDQYLFLEYKVNDNSKHEAILSSAATVTDEHDYVDGYVFKLSAVPWLKNNTENFVITLSGQDSSSIENISGYNGPVEFTDSTKKQFYYYNKKLYTNFNMLEINQTVLVTYESMCNSVYLDIELADYAKVNDYTLTLIGATRPVYTNENTGPSSSNA